MKKLYFLLAALICCFAANATDWYIVGSANGLQWSDNAKFKLTQSETNANEYSIQLAKVSGDIKFKTAGNWNSALGGNGNKLKEGVPYTASQGSSVGNITIDGEIADATVTINEQTKVVLITGAAKENEYSEVYLIGDFGSGWSETNTDKPLTLKEGTNNTYVGTYKLTASTSYFKMKAGSFVYGTGAGDVKVALETNYTAAQSGDAFSIGAGEYNFTFVLEKNADTGILTVAAAGEITYPEHFYCLGNVNNGAFLPNNGVELPAVAGSEGVYSGEVTFTGGDSETHSWFQFCTKLGSTASDWTGVEGRYGATESDMAVTFGTPMELTGNDYSFKIANGTYNITVDLKALTMTVTETTNVGVETIDVDNNSAAEYYTIQGVRVANPTEGLYIVRNGSKAQKIIIRK